jgi:outer membrane protein
LSDNKGHNFGLQIMRVPIFNGFATRGIMFKEAKLNQERYKINLKQAELDLERTVYTAVY